MPINHQQLIPYLDAQQPPVVTLTFAGIEALVGPLPRSARQRSTWWSAAPQHRFRVAHIYAWFHAGYVADVPDFAAGTVTFRRLTPRTRERNERAGR
jgi:hypothetical protein